jgi:site-specific DNA-methyltransferase (adenine-specific)
MKPYYEERGITIYHGDCREILPSIQRAQLCLTDPPYGIGLDYASFDDSEDSVQRLIQTSMPSILASADRTVLTCATRQVAWYPPSTWILCWLNRAGTGMNPWGFTCWQPILVYGKDPYLQTLQGSRPDIIEHSEPSPKNGHPCPKPVEFWKKLMKRSSVDHRDVVLDPFMGSGTTLYAAKHLGNPVIGIEVEERYCEMAAKRLAQGVFDFSQPTKAAEVFA